MLYTVYQIHFLWHFRHWLLMSTVSVIAPYVVWLWMITVLHPVYCHNSNLIQNKFWLHAVCTFVDALQCIILVVNWCMSEPLLMCEWMFLVALCENLSVLRHVLHLPSPSECSEWMSQALSAEVRLQTYTQTHTAGLDTQTFAES